jgi:hypothetical protein
MIVWTPGDVLCAVFVAGLLALFGLAKLLAWWDAR